MIKILHNDFDAQSRRFVGDFLALGREDVEVINWYNDAEQRAWVDGGGTLEICAFPTVIIGEVMLVMPSVEDVLAEVNRV